MTQGALTGREIGDFRLGELLGSGAHGDVYRAVQQGVDRDVVVKVLGAQRRDNLIARWRFAVEAKLAGQLNHPYAAHVYASGCAEPDLLWIAMEYVRGPTLSEWLAQHGPMSLAQAVPFVEKIAAVVYAAHQLGIVHRDLKPSNIIVIEGAEGADLLLKLLDLGIAKAPPDFVTQWQADARAARLRIGQNGPSTDAESADDDDEPGHVTRSGAHLGSWPFMSPEQWTAPQDVGPASDIYALGVIVYRILTGRDAFSGKTASDYREQHLRTPPPSLGAELAHADRVIQRALAKLPAERFESAPALAAELRAVFEATEVVQVQVAARQWEDRARSPAWLWGREALPVLRRLKKLAPGKLRPHECSFVASSARLGRLSTWWRRTGVIAGMVGVMAAFEYRHIVDQHSTDVIAINAEVEEGRQEILHDELSKARPHLAEAITRGDQRASTTWMLERAEQPRRAEAAMLKSPNGRGLAAVWSADSTRIAVAYDGGAALWDPSGHHPIASLDSAGPVHALAYSPRGEFIATTSDRVRIWRSDGTFVRELTAGGIERSYRAVAWSPDGRILAAVDQKRGALDCWEASSGKLQKELALGDGAYFSVAVGPRWITATAGDRIVISGSKDFELPVVQVRSLAQDPAGEHVAIATAHGGLAIWNLGTALPEARMREVGPPVDDLSWSTNGERLAVAAGDTVEIWTLSGQLLSNVHMASRVYALTWAGERVAASLVSGQIVILDGALDTIPIAVLDGHRGPVMTVKWDPRSDRLVSASLDGTFRIWRTRNAYRRLKSKPIADSCGVFTTAVPDGRYVIVPCVGRPTRVWDTLLDRQLAELPPVVENNGVAPLPIVSPDGTRAVIAQGRRAEIYSVPEGILVHSVEHSAPVTALVWGPNGLVTGDSSGSVDGDVEPRGPIDALAVLQDGRVIVADGSRGLSVTGSWRGVTSVRARLLRVSPSGRRVLVVGSTATVPELWDVSSGQRIAKLDGHTGRTWSARWTAAGDILTASADGTARRWDENGKLRTTYQADGIFLIDAVDTSGLVIGAASDGALRWWAEDSGRQVWSLTVSPRSLVGVSVNACGVFVRDIGGAVSRWGVPMPNGQLLDCDTVAR